MPNSDDTHGTHNKQTKIISQTYDGSTALTSFANVAAAKTFYFHAEALTVMDECCTILEWALVADERGDNTKLKTTFAFGTKGTSSIAEADDWAGQYNSRKTTLRDADKWIKTGISTVIVFTDSSDHIV